MSAENSALPSQEYISFYNIHIQKKLFEIAIIFHNITVFTVLSKTF